MDSFISKSISIILAVGLGYELATGEQLDPLNSASQLHSRLIDRCCQVGRERAIESPKFNCKLGARDALVGGPSAGQADRAGQLLALSADSLLGRDPNFADQCEMVLESCCLAHHRTRNCNSGKQFAKSGSACMDVELSKEATVATESFNDCCMACSLGILAARTPGQNETTAPGAPGTGPSSVAQRCKLISPLAASLAGQLYEQTYAECCEEHLPRPASALVFDSSAPIDCAQGAIVCSQRCLPAGALDPATRRPLDRDRCDCFSGYKLAPDGLSCLDLDECKLNLHTCSRTSEVCDNTRGSFRCLARGRSLALDEQAAAAPSAPVQGEQQQAPFASMRLCPPGLRWLASESRCQPAPAPDQNQVSTSSHHHRHHHHHHHQSQWRSQAVSGPRRPAGAD